MQQKGRHAAEGFYEIVVNFSQVICRTFQLSQVDNMGGLDVLTRISLGGTSYAAFGWAPQYASSLFSIDLNLTCSQVLLYSSCSCGVLCLPSVVFI